MVFGMPSEPKPESAPTILQVPLTASPSDFGPSGDLTTEAFTALRRGQVHGSQVVAMQPATYREVRRLKCSVCGLALSRARTYGRFELEDGRFGFVSGECCGRWLPVGFRAAMVDRTNWTHSPKGPQLCRIPDRRSVMS